MTSALTTKVVKVKKHVHTIMKVTDLETRETEESHKSYRNHNTFSVEDCTADLTRQFHFTEYEKHYAYYEDGDTEYVRLEGVLHGAQLKLQLDVFSCYCEPLNENHEPPF